MARTATNTNFETAKKGKNDEFYTILTDIEKELKHYKKQFRDKVVYCNCDVSTLPTPSCQVNQGDLTSRHAKKSEIQQRRNVSGH